MTRPDAKTQAVRGGPRAPPGARHTPVTGLLCLPLSCIPLLDASWVAPPPPLPGLLYTTHIISDCKAVRLGCFDWGLGAAPLRPPVPLSRQLCHPTPFMNWPARTPRHPKPPPRRMHTRKYRTGPQGVGGPGGQVQWRQAGAAMLVALNDKGGARAWLLLRVSE